MNEKEEGINPENLVLKLNENTLNLDISKYEDFLIGLCNEREYQKEAIRKVIKFFLSEDYKSILDLVKENYEKNSYIQEHFETDEDLIKQLQFKYN